MKRNPWLTDADLAEVAVVAHALVEMGFAHRERCSVCKEQGSAFCEPRMAAIDAAVVWVERRTLTSKAETLRLLHLNALAALSGPTKGGPQ